MGLGLESLHQTNRMVTIISFSHEPYLFLLHYVAHSLTGYLFIIKFLVPPEVLYATQLSQLQEMGFFDTRENIQALIATAGNVHVAVERLLGNTDQ